MFAINVHNSVWALERYYGMWAHSLHATSTLPFRYAHGYGYGYWLSIALRRSTLCLSVNCQHMNWCELYLENVGNYCNIKLLLPHSQCKLEWHALAMTHDHIACSECSTNRPHSCIVDEFGFWNFEWIACAHYYYYYCSSLASESICSGLRKFLVDSVGWQVLALAIELTPFDYLTYFVWPIFLRIFPFCILSNFLSPLRLDWFLL